MSIVPQSNDLVRMVITRLPMPSAMRAVLLLVWDTIQNYGSHRGSEAAAALAYYGLFSIFPLLLFVIGIISYLVRSSDAQLVLASIVAGAIPGSEQFVLDTVSQVQKVRGPLSVVAVAGLVWSGSGLFSALAVAIGRAWSEDRSRPAWKQRLVGVALTLLVGLLIVLATAGSGTVQVLARYGDMILPLELAQFIGRFDLVGFSLATLLNVLAFFVLYTWLPALTVPWRAALIGAAVAGVVWETAKGVFAWYLATYAVRNFTQVYGPLAAVLALLLWTYVSAVILLLGAELGAAYAKTGGWRPPAHRATLRNEDTDTHGKNH